MFSRLAIERGNVLPDLIAGAAIATIKVPQSMANAVLASVNPIAGIYALMVAMPVGALLSSSVFMNVSASGALAISVGESLYEVPYEQKTGALVLLVLMIGVAQVLMGAAGLGRLTRYVSNSVLTAFMLGVSILIIITALRDITGFESQQSDHFLRLAETALHWRQFETSALVIGLAVILVALLAERTRYYKFGLIIAMAVATLAALLLDATWSAFSVLRIGDVTYLSPYFSVPVLPDIQHLDSLLLPAVSIAIIGLVQSAAVGQSFPNPDGDFPNASRDFVGQGAANMASSFVGGIPSNGSLSGTSVLVKVGARSCWANIFGGVFVLIILVLFLGVIEVIPIAAMGGLLFVIGLQNIQPIKIREIWTTGLVSRSAFLGTLFATLFFPLHLAIFLGVLLSFFLQVLHLANRLELRQLHLVEGGFPVDMPGPIVLEDNAPCIIHVRGVLFFASSSAFAEKLPPPGSGHSSVVVLILRDVDEVGSTIVRSLAAYADRLSKNGNKIVLAGISASLKGQLERTGLARAIGEENIFEQKNFSGESVNEAVISARAWIDAKRGEQ